MNARTFSIGLLILLAITLSGCGLSRKGEFQSGSSLKPMPIIALVAPGPNESPEPTFKVVYVSKVQPDPNTSLYITEGDIVVASASAQAAQAQQQNARASFSEGQSQQFRISNSKEARHALDAAYGKQGGDAFLRRLLVHGFYLHRGSSRAESARAVTATAATAYAYVPPAQAGQPGVYLPVSGARWQGPIPYCVSKTVEYPGTVQLAISTWEGGTGLKFAPKPDATCAQYDSGLVKPTNHMIWFIWGAGCDSSVGELQSSTNIVHLNKNCADKGGVMHEIGHALGLHHEQDRSDAGDYIAVLDANIIPEDVQWFHPQKNTQYAPFGYYDCDSIMHYPAYAFQKAPGLDTIEPIKGKACENVYLGQRDHLSNEDITEIRTLYNLGTPGPSPSP